MLCCDVNLKKAIVNLTCLKSKYTDERSCILSDIYYVIGIHPKKLQSHTQTLHHCKSM